MFEGRQEKIYNTAYDAYVELADVLKDYAGQFEPVEGLTNLSPGAIFDLQLQKIFLGFSRQYEDEVSTAESYFIHHLIANEEELVRNVEGYRRYANGISFDSFEGIPENVRESLPSIPCCVSLALNMDRNRQDEFTTVLFKEYITLLDCYISLNRENGEKRREVIEEETKRLEAYVFENNSFYKAFDTKAIFESLWYLRDEAKAVAEKEKTLEELLAELDSMVGLQAVKDNVHELVNVLEVRKERTRRGLDNDAMSLHMVFDGNPGTGKTTVARIIAQIYKKMGLLPKGQLVETDRSDLVAGYIGQSEQKTKERIDQAMGGILFIDEAYALTDTGADNDFGKSVINVLIKAMEDNRDNLVVIVAGYTDKMSAFLASNPGMKSRFNTFIHFDDYNAEEMVRIFQGMCSKSGYLCTMSATKLLRDKLSDYCSHRMKDFANGRDVRNFYEKVVRNQHRRVIMTYPDLSAISDEDLRQIKEEDLKDIDF